MLASVMCCCAATYQKITVWTSEKIPKPVCSTFLHHSALGQHLLGYGHVEPYVMRLGWIVAMWDCNSQIPIAVGAGVRFAGARSK
ncbi:hypothetical protein SCH4B_4220 [Ruegeria sp. TrichCH4B]|nr:hypothetical protein SCH4B_4220 [Ruegeria sp. TrichCH4B]